MNKYGNVITSLRQEKGMSQDVLANILLMLPEQYADVERGAAELSETQMNLCANVFNISADALKNGDIKPRATTAELFDGLSRFAKLYKSAVESEAYILEILQQFQNPSRYTAEYSEDKNIYGFFVFDTQSDDFVRDEKGNPLYYETAKAALEAAGKFEADYKKAGKAPEPSPEHSMHADEMSVPEEEMQHESIRM